MAFVPVISYEVDWNTAVDQYRINIWLQNGSQGIPLKLDTDTEFLAVLTMLGRAGVVFDPGGDNAAGDLRLPQRPVGT